VVKLAIGEAFARSGLLTAYLGCIRCFSVCDAAGCAENIRGSGSYFRFAAGAIYSKNLGMFYIAAIRIAIIP